MSYGFLMGGLVQAASGRHIRDVVRSDLALPLGIADEFMMGLGSAPAEGQYLPCLLFFLFLA